MRLCKIKYVEKYFGGKNDFKPIEIEVEGEQYRISGIIDRIDVCDDYFRLIDYKTGETSNSKGKEYLFYGTKVQLFVYAEAVKSNLNKKIFGTFYLPIKNSYSSEGRSEYCFSGFHINSVCVAGKCDKTLLTDKQKSDILNCSLLKTTDEGEATLRKKSNIISEEELYFYNKYAIEMVKMTIKNINEGYFDCSPLKGKCNVCEFNKICKDAGNEKIERGEDYEITNEIFLRLNYD